MPQSAEYTTDTIVTVNHSRKGRFCGRVIRDDGEFLSVEVIDGKPAHANGLNALLGESGPGMEMTFRKSLARITTEPQ